MATKTTKTNENPEIMEVEQAEQKAAVNVLDLLLGSDVGDIKLPTKEVEITRLSERYRIWHSL